MSINSYPIDNCNCNINSSFYILLVVKFLTTSDITVFLCQKFRFFGLLLFFYYGHWKPEKGLEFSGRRKQQKHLSGFHSSFVT